MKPMTSSITHFYHSGFAVETVDHFLVFDYVFPPDENNQVLMKKWITPEMLKEKRNIYVFVSHHHSDHFMPEIMNWSHQFPGIHYVFSDDVPVDHQQNIHFLKPGDHLKINEVTIKTYDSTDEGVSFLVQVDQLSFFHSGDLNWWHWKDFSPEKQKQEEKEFKDEVELISNQTIDVAFVPVDPRLGDAYYLAGQYFFEKVKPDFLIPMHFRDNFDITHAFSTKMNVPEKSIATLHKRGEKLFYSKS